jgi:hypothetical protein
MPSKPPRFAAVLGETRCTAQVLLQVQTWVASHSNMTAQNALQATMCMGPALLPPTTQEYGHSLWLCCTVHLPLQYNTTVVRIQLDNRLDDPSTKLNGTKLNITCPSGVWSEPYGVWDNMNVANAMVATPVEGLCPDGHYAVQFYIKPSQVGGFQSLLSPLILVTLSTYYNHRCAGTHM